LKLKTQKSKKDQKGVTLLGGASETKNKRHEKQGEGKHIIK